MKRRRHTPEQIVRKLREVERLLGEGQTIAEAAKQVEISEQTYHRWRNQYGGMKADDAKRLRELERENARAEADRRRQGTRYRRAQGDRPGKLVGPSRRREAVCMLQDRLGLSERRACRVTGQTPLHAAPPPGARPRRRRAAEGVTRLLAWPPPLGVPPGVGELARGGLERESQAGATALA